MDLSFVGDGGLYDDTKTGAAPRSGRNNPTRHRIVLGIVDHGTRACIALSELADKSSSAIWCELLRCFRQFGIPKRLRVDNEACFHGIILRGALALLGVRMQNTDLGSPWQNGRIERLFGTFKRDLARIVEGDFARLLAQWRWYYNFALPHQHLNVSVRRSTSRFGVLSSPILFSTRC